MYTPATLTLEIDSEAQMQRLGSVLARLLPLQPRIWLRGDLGAGKSTLARACLRAMGITGPIKSPTYTLIERYALQDGGEAWHLDLYRIADPEELEYLGLDEAGVRFWLIEWPQRGTGALAEPDLELEIAHNGPEARIVKIMPRNRESEMEITKLLEDFH